MMSNKSKDNQDLCSAFIQHIDKPLSSLDASKAETLFQTEEWKRITHRIDKLNYHRSAYTLRKNIDTIKQKLYNVPSFEPHSFYGFYNLDEDIPSLDRADKKHLSKVAYHQISVVDLHGCTLAQGYEKLKLALSQSRHKKSKVLKVITGKGRPNPEPESPTLKAIFPKWMQEPYFKLRVYKVRAAPKKHGGEGAFLVYLKLSEG